MAPRTKRQTEFLQQRKTDLWPSEERMITATEAGRLLGLDPLTVNALWESGDLSIYRLEIGTKKQRLIRYREADVLLFRQLGSVLSPNCHIYAKAPPIK